MALDTLVSQVSYRARLLERALHDPGPWTMTFTLDGLVMQTGAVRTLLPDGVEMQASFPWPIGIEPGRGMVTLSFNGEPVAFFEADAAPTGFTVSWAMRAWVTDESRQP